MSEADLFLYGGFLILAIAILFYFLDRKKAWWIVEEKIGRRIEVEKERDTYPVSKEFPIKLRDERHNLISYAAVKVKKDGKYDLIDDQGNLIREIDPTKNLWWLNHESFFKGKGVGELAFQVADKSYTAHLKEENEALHLANLSVNEELIGRSKSIHSVLKQDAENENKRWHALYRGRRYMQRPQDSKGRKDSDMVSVQSDDGGEGD